MAHVELAQLFKQFHAQVAKAAGAGAGVVEFTGPGFGVGDELLQIGDGGHLAGVHHDHDGQVVNRGHGGEILHRVVTGFLVHVRRQQRGRGQHHQGVAVGRAFHHLLGRNRPGRAGPVFHHHRLLEPFRQFLAEDARGGVGRATGRERHDELDGFAWPGVGPGAGGHQRQQRQHRTKQGAAGEMGNLHVRTFKKRDQCSVDGGSVKTPLACSACSSCSDICKSFCSSSRVPSPKVGGALRIGRRSPSSR